MLVLAVWLFLGDSITQQAISPDIGINAGVGGATTSDAIVHIDEWLDRDGDYVVLAFGTNDVTSMSVEQFDSNYQELIRRVRSRGKIAVVPTIPYSRAREHIALYNARLRRLDVRHGPDFYAYFAAHPDELAPDGIHLNAQGNESYRRLWRESMATATGIDADPVGLALSYLPLSVVDRLWAAVGGTLLLILVLLAAARMRAYLARPTNP